MLIIKNEQTKILYIKDKDLIVTECNINQNNHKCNIIYTISRCKINHKITIAILNHTITSAVIKDNCLLRLFHSTIVYLLEKQKNLSAVR